MAVETTLAHDGRAPRERPRSRPEQRLRISRWLAWALVLGTFATSALLRQFHDRTPTAPRVSPIVGSALFAAIVLLLLVTVRERTTRPQRGSGLRLGLVTPIMLLLLIEKWASLMLYPPLYEAVLPESLDPRWDDALFISFAGVALILLCLVTGWLSLPTLRKTWRRARPARWPAAALAGLAVVGGSYLALGALSLLLGGGLRLTLPRLTPLLISIVLGQAVLAFAEELYYRGLLLAEMERLAPRLGVRSAGLRRWVALLSTSLLFGLEHLDLGPPWQRSWRELVFVISLGLLFGMLVIAGRNLHFAAAVHAWINWLLLGAAPHFVDRTGHAALPAGTYIGVALVLAFSLTYVLRGPALRPSQREPVFES